MDDQRTIEKRNKTIYKRQFINYGKYIRNI